MTRSAFVTGGNRGIGRAIAEALQSSGFEVTIGVRDETEGQKAAQELDVRAVLCDLLNLDTVPDEVSRCDVLINNAGVLYEAPVLAPDARFEDTLAVMLGGPYRLMQVALPQMITRGYGRVVNMSSDWGSFHEGLHGPGAYGVAKAALNALTLAVSRDVPKTVKVNAMCPGWVNTRMGGASAPRRPEEGADTAIWLATLPEDGPTGGFFRDRKPLAW